MSFSPETGLVYIPARDTAGYYNDKGIDPKIWRMGRDGTVGLNHDDREVPENAGRSYLLAWDPVKQKEVWHVDTPGLTAGGTLVTAGGLVFQPRADGKFVAYDAQDGKPLWSFDMGVGSQAPAITYSVNGRQYVSLLAGWAGQAMMLGSASAAHGWVGREHPRRLLTFALDGEATLPVSAPAARPVPVDDPGFQLDSAKVERGQVVFRNCMICHGLSAVAGGFAPDLRASPMVLSNEAFSAVVHGGALEQRGMPAFPELPDSDLDALQHYLRSRARESLKEMEVKASH